MRYLILILIILAPIIGSAQIDKIPIKQLDISAGQGLKLNGNKFLVDDQYFGDAATLSVDDILGDLIDGNGINIYDNEVSVKVSSDANNGLEVKQDNSLYVPAPFKIGTVTQTTTPNPYYIYASVFDNKSKGMEQGAYSLDFSRIDDQSYSYHIGQYSFASGRNTEASGIGTFVSGNLNIASGKYSFSSGIANESSGAFSFTTGTTNLAEEIGSVVMGYHNISSNPYSLTIGRYSEDVPGSAFTVGNGVGSSQSNRKNIYNLYNDGHSEQEGTFEITNDGSGIILSSPNGTRYEITVEDNGTLTTTQL